jgi:ATP-binding cassette subfamily F protein uup
MDRLVDHLFVFEGDGIIRDFPGNYSQYRLWQKEQEAMGNTYLQFHVKEAEQKSNTDRQTLDNKKKKPSFNDKREFELLEKEIVGLSKEKETITEKLNNGNTPLEELQQLSHRIGEVTRLLDEKELRWLELSEVQ